MRAEIDEADHLTREALIQQIAHGKEIAQRFGHLLALDLQHLVMHPDLRELPRGVGAAALRDFVFMMGELQIDPAAVNVKSLAQQFAAHGGTFDMPARTPAAPRGRPARQIIARGFPQHEIHRIALVGRHFNPRARDHVIDRPPRQRAIAREAADIEQHMPLGRIGMAARDQPFDHADHRGDIFGRAGFMGGAQRAKRVHIGVIPADGFIGDVADRTARLGGLGVDLVIHVGEVADIGHRICAIDMAQQTEQRVKHHHRAGIADMGAVIDGGTTDIHPHLAGDQRLQILFAARFGVVEPDRGHGATLLPSDPTGLAVSAPDENTEAPAGGLALRETGPKRGRCAQVSRIRSDNSRGLPRWWHRGPARCRQNR